MSVALVAAIQSRFGDAILDSHDLAGDDTVTLRKDALVDVCRYLREDPSCQMEMLVDVTAIDWQEKRSERYEVVYHLHSLSLKHRLRIKVAVSEEDLTVPTLTGIWRGANWPERETWDMYGIRFDGHPDLRRLLLYPEFEGHPLRKDYPVRGYQPLVDMPSLPVDREDSEE